MGARLDVNNSSFHAAADACETARDKLRGLVDHPDVGQAKRLAVEAVAPLLRPDVRGAFAAVMDRTV